MGQRRRLRAVTPEEGAAAVRLPTPGETLCYGRLRIGAELAPILATIWPRDQRPALADGEVRWHPGAGGLWLRLDLQETPPCDSPPAPDRPRLAVVSPC